MIAELTEYAKQVLRDHPQEVAALQQRQAIYRALKGCGLVVISIAEMNVLLNIKGVPDA